MVALVFVLFVIGVLAVAMVPLMIASARRRQRSLPVAVGGRQRETRDALLARMQATVMESSNGPGTSSPS